MSKLFPHPTFSLIALFLLCSLSASAQLDQLKNKAKNLKKDDEKTQKSTTPSETPAAKPAETPASSAASPKEAAAPRGNTTSNQRPDRAALALAPSTVELDFESEPFSPAIAWYSLLNDGCIYFNITNGQLSVNNLMVSFLPKKTKSGEAVNYAGYANPTPLLRMDLIETTSNTPMGTLHFEAKPYILPFYEMEKLVGGAYKSALNIKEGNYEMRFFAGNKPFYTYAFSVIKKSNPDPYAPVHDLYFLQGAWNDWARVEFGPDNDFIFSFYLTDNDVNIKNQSVWDEAKDCAYMIKLFREGQMAGVYSLENVGNATRFENLRTRNGLWKRFDATLYAFPIISKGTGAGSKQFLKKDQLKDGNYTIELLLKDKAGVQSNKTFGFTVKGGQIQPDPQADRAVHKDPLTIIEQGRTFYYVRKK